MHSKKSLKATHPGLSHTKPLTILQQYIQIIQQDTPLNNIPRKNFYAVQSIWSHSLCNETGRWNRRGRGRLPHGVDLIPCVISLVRQRGPTQLQRTRWRLSGTQHSIAPLSHTIRDAYHFSNLDEVFSGRFDSKTQCKSTNEKLEIYKQI